MDDLNRSTMAVVLKGAATQDAEAMLRISDADEKLKSNPEMAYSAVRRAAEWHDKQAEEYHRKAEQLRSSELKMKLEDPRKGLKQLSRVLKGSAAQPLMHIRRTAEDADAETRSSRIYGNRSHRD